MNPTLFIGIAGGSCSGKGYLTSLLQEELLNCVVIPIDVYYRDLSHVEPSRRTGFNFDVPAAIDCDMLFAHLGRLSVGETIELPAYDFATHTRTKEVRRVEARGKLVVVEGLFALYWEEIRKLLSLKVFIELDWRTCLARRVERDVSERGRTAENVELQYRDTVLPMYEKYIAPTRCHANCLLQGDVPIGESLAKVINALQRLRKGD